MLRKWATRSKTETDAEMQKFAHSTLAKKIFKNLAIMGASDPQGDRRHNVGAECRTKFPRQSCEKNPHEQNLINIVDKNALL